MRCKNCGWPNKPGESNCIKCHTPLVSDNDDVVIEQNQPNYTPSDNRPLNKTVMEEDIFGAGNAGGYNKRQDNSSSEGKQCPKCGYILRAGTEKCPNCNYAINKPTEPEESYEPSRHSGDEKENRRPTRMTGGDNRNGFKGTVNPYMMNMEMEPTFILKPLKKVNERHDFEEQEYEGSEVVLKRDNTDANNPSITSRQQAVITHKDGVWYIEDKSEQKTTFVQASRKVELHDGDLILLGNRLFEFHE